MEIDYYIGLMQMSITEYVNTVIECVIWMKKFIVVVVQKENALLNL